MPLVKLNTGVTRHYSDRDAKLLVLVKKGVIVDSQPEQAPQVEAQEPQQTEENKPKRAYKRKDLRSES